MPSNIIQINSSEELKWIISDSYTDILIKELDEKAERLESISENSS